MLRLKVPSDERWVLLPRRATATTTTATTTATIKKCVLCGLELEAIL